MTKLKNIIYRNWDGDRKVVIVNGIPYYCSTGSNSSCPNVWFPFISLRGTKPVNIECLPFYLSKEKLNRIFRNFEPTYIVKLDALYFIQETELFPGIDPDDGFAGRISTKETLITSLRLSGEHFPPDKLALVNLSPEEKLLAKQPLIIQENPLYTISNPDTVNKWLVSEGAVIASALLSKKRLTLDDAVHDSSHLDAKGVDPLLPTIDTCTMPVNTKELSFFKEEPPTSPGKKKQKAELSTRTVSTFTC
jgi:hypothetical protein